MTRDYLRKQARGKPCQVRVPGICDGGGDTTVLAHYRLAGYCGVGMKPPDALGAWCCGPCHAVCDQQGSSQWSHDELSLMLAEGVMRTLVERAKLEAQS